MDDFRILFRESKCQTKSSNDNTFVAANKFHPKSAINLNTFRIESAQSWRRLSLIYATLLSKLWGYFHFELWSKDKDSFTYTLGKLMFFVFIQLFPVVELSLLTVHLNLKQLFTFGIVCWFLLHSHEKCLLNTLLSSRR